MEWELRHPIRTSPQFVRIGWCKILAPAAKNPPWPVMAWGGWPRFYSQLKKRDFASSWTGFSNEGKIYFNLLLKFLFISEIYKLIFVFESKALDFYWHIFLPHKVPCVGEKDAEAKVWACKHFWSLFHHLLKLYAKSRMLPPPSHYAREWQQFLLILPN